MNNEHGFSEKHDNYRETREKFEQIIDEVSQLSLEEVKAYMTT